ncbi:DUF6931 family protein [Photobacterium satsumensis]|uniref:DUF6931 family protein n=1 Tax=Photobacterium satsumensis TaxID=2910239 RepID=UPI003D11770E
MKKIPYISSGPILAGIELSEDAEGAVQREGSPTEVIEQLTKAGCYIDLAHFFAHALPMREAIWWCVQSIRLRQTEWNAAEAMLVDDCERWVREPNEAIRRNIEKQIVTLKNDRAPKWLGQAVFWSGTGSIAPVDNPIVMPVDYLYAKAVAGAVNTAAVIPEWKSGNKTVRNGHQKYYQRAFEIALDIANGGSGKTAQGIDATQGGDQCHALLD